MRLFTGNQLVAYQLFPRIRNTDRSVYQMKNTAQLLEFIRSGGRAYPKAIVGNRAGRDRPEFNEVLRHDAEVNILQQ